MRVSLSVVLLAGALGAMPKAGAYYAGGGSDTERGNDCLIGYDGIEADDVVAGSRRTFTCEDCDWSCDRDGVATANGSCVIPAAGNFVIDAAANLPGPGAISLPGTFELLP